jgi:hypothetical protein
VIKNRVVSGHNKGGGVVKWSIAADPLSWDTSVKSVKFPFDLERFLRRRWVPAKLILKVIGCWLYFTGRLKER